MKSLAALVVLVGLGALTCACEPPAPRVATSVAPPVVVDVSPAAVPGTSSSSSSGAPAAASPAPPAPSVGSVRPGSQRALNALAIPFARYLNAMHNRIHVHFADETLAKLDALGRNDPLNDAKLTTRVEVVIDGKSGSVVKVSVVKTSGNATFDGFGLDAVQRAAPFGAADAAIWSTDGNVYVHWEFWRDEVFACSTMHARPYLLDLGAAPP